MSEFEFPIVIEVAGEAQPAGSKRAWVPKDKHGNPIQRKDGSGFVVNTVDDNKKSKPWKQSVSGSAQMQYLGPILRGPLVVEFIFYRVRPKAHFGTGRNEGIVKDSAPAYPTTKPDVLKLARAVEDALTGIVWMDDAQIVDERIAKRYGDKAKVVIRVWPAEHLTVADLVVEGKLEPKRPDVLWEQLELVPAA